MNHDDPADCQLNACQRCDDYAGGYGAAQLEFQHHDITAHAAGCGCAPCTTWAQATAGIVELMLQVRNEGVGSVDGLKQKLCEDICSHSRCAVIYSLERLYIQTKAEVDDHNARALHDRRN